MADPISVREALTDVLELTEQRYERRNHPAIRGLPTGFVDMDNLTGGLHPGQLTVLGGRPGTGKSILLSNIAAHVAIDLKRPTMMVTIGESTTSTITRMLAAVARIDGERFESGRLLDDDWPKLSAAMGRLSLAPLHLARDLDDLEDHCRDIGGVDLVLIDALDELMQVDVEWRDLTVRQAFQTARGLAQGLDAPGRLFDEPT